MIVLVTTLLLLVAILLALVSFTSSVVNVRSASSDSRKTLPSPSPASTPLRPRSLPTPTPSTLALKTRRWRQRRRERAVAAHPAPAQAPPLPHIKLVPLLQPCVECRMREMKQTCSSRMCRQCCLRKPTNLCVSHGDFHARLESIVTEASGTEDLDLSYLKILLVPPCVFALTHLISLSLNDNKLTSIPSEIGLLTSLEQLYVHYNELTRLPESVADLLNLRELRANNNLLTRLPSRIGALSQLHTAIFTENRIRRLPESISQLHALTELSLYGNPLEEFPSATGLSALEELYLGNSRLTELPRDFGAMTALVSLDVSHCALTALPSSLWQCTQLERLYANGNQLTRLPERWRTLTHLRELHLSHNQLTSLPYQLLHISLVNITVTDNELIMPSQAKTRSALWRHPSTTSESTASLRELSARAFFSIHHQSDAAALPWLPRNLRTMLAQPRFCSHCDGVFFDFHLTRLVHAPLLHSTLPFIAHLCSPHHLTSFHANARAEGYSVWV